MLTARQPASPSDGEPPDIRPAAPLTSIQNFESPDDAAQDQLTQATTTPADRPPAEWPPAAAGSAVPPPGPVRPSSPGLARPSVPAPGDTTETRAVSDLQTTSGVPATAIPGAATRTPSRDKGPAQPGPDVRAPQPERLTGTGPTGSPGATPHAVEPHGGAGSATGEPGAATPSAETTQRLPRPPAVHPAASADITQRLPVVDAETTQRLPVLPAAAPGGRQSPGESRKRLTTPAPVAPPSAEPAQRLPAPPAPPACRTMPPGYFSCRPQDSGSAALGPATSKAAAPAAKVPEGKTPAGKRLGSRTRTAKAPGDAATGDEATAGRTGTGRTTVSATAPPVVPGRAGAPPRNLARPGSAQAPVVPPDEAPTGEAPAVAEPSVAADAAARTRQGAAPRSRIDLARAPAVLAVSSIGVLLVALAYAAGRDGAEGALTVYWVGQLVVFTPVAARLLMRRTAGVAESFMLVMGLAVNQYLLKWMYSPDQFRFPDELQHWLATTVLMQSGELFRPNPALPPAVHFPGLAEMGAATADLTGLSVTAAGMLVAGVAHLLFVAALFALVLRISDSPAVAGVACVVYATALHYLFFNSMYLYATGALPFLMVAVWAVRRWRTGGGAPFAGLAVACMFAATATHHVTAFMLAATLALVGVIEFVVAGRSRRWTALVMPAAAFAIVGAWIAFVAPDVIAYLEAPVDQVLNTVAVLLDDKPVDGTATSAEVSLVQLGVQGAGLLVLFALYLSVGVDMLQRHDRDAWRWAALIGGGIFFAGNGVRFLGQNGPEIAGRLNTFTYVPISIIAGIALVRATRLIPRRNAAGRFLRGGPAPQPAPAHGSRPAMRIVAAAAGVTLLMIGARMGGWPPSWALLPGPYLVAGYERSVDAAGVAAARWQRAVLGPGHRVGGDVAAVALSSTYGMQDPVRESAPLFYADEWTGASEGLVRNLAVDYLVVDRRLSTQLPALDAYFEHDPLAGRHTGPMTAAQLAKFDDVPWIDRLYDNGDIRIYRTGVQ